MAPRILLVEDDQLIVESLVELLSSEGYAIDSVSTQREAISRVLLDPAEGDGTPYALVLLDVTLAEGNGFAVCSAIKQQRPELPVIFLTASDDEFTTVAGIQMGADDYIAKPFRPRELLARVAAVIRRSGSSRGSLRLGPLLIDVDRAHVERSGRDVVLSALEYRLLLLFAMNAGKLVSRDMIREALWDEAGTYIEENTLSVYIKRLRDKIEDDPSEPRLIVTVRGLGYKAVG